MEEDAAQQVALLPCSCPLPCPVRSLRRRFLLLSLRVELNVSNRSQEPLIPLVTSMLESTPVKLEANSFSKHKSG